MTPVTTTLPNSPPQVDRQAAAVAGLRQLADFLEQAPKLPLSSNDTTLGFRTAANWRDEHSNSWGAAPMDMQIARVRTWAAILGVEVTVDVAEDGATYYRAERTFGAVVTGISCIDRRTAHAGEQP
jgi:hypothetical protein